MVFYTKKVVNFVEALAHRFLLLYRLFRSIVQKHRKKFALAVVILISFVFLAPILIVIRRGWRTAAAENVECQRQFQPLPYNNNGYIEFYLEKQDELEPVFEGSYFINLTQEYGRNALRLKVVSGGARAYGDSISFANLQWDDSAQLLWMTAPVKMPFISLSGTHRDFPFDSARFDYSLRVEPAVNIPVFRFNNRVPGFYMPCDATTVQRRQDGSFQISFELRRDLLTQVTAAVLFVVAAIFAFAITLFVELKTLPTAVASYFFSLWSIRAILGLSAGGFPTLLDVAILALCLLMLVLLIIRLTIAVLLKAGGVAAS